MAKAGSHDLTDRFVSFYRNYYAEEIAALAQRYPREQRSLYVDYDDLYQFDADLAEDLLAQPDQFREYAEEALRLYDLPVDVDLGRAHVRLENLPETVDIRGIRVHDNHIGRLVAVQGIVRKATDVRPKVTEAAFECQRCGTMTYIPQSDGGFQEPHECQGCERQGPFRVNLDQSEFVDSQSIRVQESPEGLRGGETPQSIDVNLEDDVTGLVTPGDHVTVVGVLHIEQQTSGNEKTPIFDLYMDGVTVTVEDEEFEDMDIEPADVERIREYASREDVYDLMVDSIAPSIYGYDDEKLALTLQLFSGVTKHLPDDTRIRGDMHVLLIGDPGTGKCVAGDTTVTLADGTEHRIRDLVESNLDDPVPVDDGVYDDVDLDVVSLTDAGEIEPRRATRVWKREAPDRMYRLRTASGRELEVTPSHPLFVQSGGRPVPVQARDLSEGAFVATPRVLRTRPEDALDVGTDRPSRGRVNEFDAPAALSPPLARLLGYLVAEGHVQTERSTATITNADQEVTSDVVDCYEALGLRYSVYDRPTKPGIRRVVCSSAEFVDFLRKLGPSVVENSADRRVPDALLRASPAVKRAFLRAYVEGEGHVDEDERELTVASMSRELLAGVRSLLLAFGVGAQLGRRENGSYRLRVSGRDFGAYVDAVGFVTERKTAAAAAHPDGPGNTNTDLVPGLAEDLRRLRRALALSQSDCGVPRTTYQHYERGDRNPSRRRLSTVLDSFRERLDELRALRERIADGEWDDIEAVRSDLNLSQRALADRMDVSQTAVSYYERRGVAPDGGRTAAAKEAVLDRIDEALSVAPDLQSLRQLTANDVTWDRIESIETVAPEDDWVYDLEVEDTHSYLSNGVVSHNSQLLQYIQNIAPRSVYTSGKGSSAAGLCVTGDTMVHTTEGFRPIREVAEEHHPTPVSEETAAEATHELYTFDREAGTVERAESSRVWRMPEKECRRIETSHGKELEASAETPVLVCGAGGMEWRPVSEVETGDHVAVPKYGDVGRSSPPVRSFFEFTREKLKPTDESVAFLRRRLREEFGTLRDAAAALELPEAFVYDSLSNRHLPLDRLRRVLDAVGAELSDIEIERAMLRHGDGVEIPDSFDRDLMYLIGLVFGDGNVMTSARGGNRGRVRISNSDEELLETAAAIVERQFGKAVDIEHQDDRVPSIRLHSATVARFFGNLGVESPKEDIALDPRLTTAEHADAFLRGLFDADGSVSAREAGGSSVQFSTTCDRLARQVQLMLETYGVRARRRRRDRRGTYELADGYEIESTSVQTHLAIYGADVDRFAAAVGFRSAGKAAALSDIVRDASRRGDRLPVGDALVRADGAGGAYYQNLVRGDDPSRARARSMLDERDLGDVGDAVEAVAEADLVWDEVVAATDTGRKEVFDLTVPDTHNFLGNGVVTHNTAAAVQDDFGEGQQWTLEAGALVLADKGIAAVDELDKMSPEDRSAMHEGLEQQKISVSKAGINATLKARCALLGAANPKMGRFDEYEPIGEQIDLDPALISRFDLIFTVTDQPDPERDAELAEHILTANFAGELATQRTQLTRPNHDQAEVEAATRNVEPAIDADLLRKYVAYAKRECYPTMREEAREAIRDFYVEMREQGAREDAPVPVTARKLEALVRLAEASARVRLSDYVEREDAERVIDIIRASLRDIGMDPETGEFDADIVETGTSKSQRDRIKNLKGLIEEIEAEYEEGAPVDEVLERAEDSGMDRTKAEDEIEKLKTRGELYEPRGGHLRTT